MVKKVLVSGKDGKGFNIPVTVHQPVIVHKFPARLVGWEFFEEICLPEVMDIKAARLFIRNTAKSHRRLYFMPIETGVLAETRFTGIIPVDTLGRWLFGVPGYRGHTNILVQGSHCKIEFPRETPLIAQILIVCVREAIEN